MPAADDTATTDAPVRFVVVADSHIRPPDQEVDAYPSNALMVARNEFIVALCNRVDAAFVVHLGDIVHPLPVEDAHLEAIDLAHGVYRALEHPIHFVPGNHDVGDKPNSFVAVPPVAEANYAVYEEAWGPPYHSFDVDGCHFVVLDTQLLNSGLERERRQRDWFERDLAEAVDAGSRIFVFTHYPPFVRDGGENEHYDNLGEPARSWFLDLLERHGVEAVFSGHVHNFLYNRWKDTDLYVAPSTGFVRPDYAELAAVVPSAENGRDDPPKLGIFVVDVTEDGHRVQPVRSHGSTGEPGDLPVALDVMLDPAWESPVGVTLRHPWTAVVDFPTAGLDEFRRKSIRNDAPLLSLWEARIHHVRVPVSDVSSTSGTRRALDLASRGMRFTVFSTGIPDDGVFAAVRGVVDAVERWEIVARPDQFAGVLSAVGDGPALDVPTAMSPITPIGPPGDAVHHFVASGFPPQGDGHLTELMELDARGLVTELTFRVPASDDVASGVGRAVDTAEARGRRAVVVVELPRGSESTVFDDDAAVARRVEQAVTAARAHPSARVFLDAFGDHDRGYYPRHGLVDRSHNPRSALYRLIEVSAGPAPGR